MSNNCILSCAPIIGSVVAVVYSPCYNVEMAPPPKKDAVPSNQSTNVYKTMSLTEKKLLPSNKSTYKAVYRPQLPQFALVIAMSSI